MQEEIELIQAIFTIIGSLGKELWKGIKEEQFN
jgi:hypothetical protein